MPKNVLNFPTAQGPTHQGVSGAPLGQVPFKPESRGNGGVGQGKGLPSPESYYGQQQSGPQGPGSFQGPASGAGAVGGGAGMGVGAFNHQGQTPLTTPQPDGGGGAPPATQDQQPGLVRRGANWVASRVPWWGWGLVVGTGLYMAYRYGQGKHPVPFMGRRRRNRKPARVVIDAVAEDDED